MSGNGDPYINCLAVTPDSFILFFLRNSKFNISREMQLENEEALSKINLSEQSFLDPNKLR